MEADPVEGDLLPDCPLMIHPRIMIGNVGARTAALSVARIYNSRGRDVLRG
jgi:hypothetical protein